MGYIFCVEFRMYDLKLHTKHFTHISRNVYFIQTLKFDFVNVLETSPNYSVDWTLCTFLIYRGNLTSSSLQWRQNGRDSVSNHQPHDCFLFRLFRHRSKKTSKLCVTGLCVGISPEAGEFPAQMASYAENVSIWWRHHVNDLLTLNVKQHIHVVRHGRSHIFLLTSKRTYRSCFHGR